MKYCVSYFPEDRLDGTDVVKTTSFITTNNKKSALDIAERVLELDYVKWLRIEIINEPR